MTNGSGYYELHHILPKCIGGNDDVDNLVYLLPEEHYVAHMLLVKIYEDPKLAHAANMMSKSSKNNRRNNKSYAWVRKRHAKSISENQSGKGNSQYGTFWITNGSENKKLKSSEVIPEGWRKGRSNLWNETQRKEIAERNRNAQLGTTRSKETREKISKKLRKTES